MSAEQEEAAAPTVPRGEFVSEWRARVAAEEEAERLEGELEKAQATTSRLQADLEEGRNILAVFTSADREALANHRPKWGLADCVDNTGTPYQSQSLADALSKASSFLQERKGE